MRLSICLLILLASPTWAQSVAPHALPFPTGAAELHAVELTLGGAAGEALSVRAATAPPWLRFEAPGAPAGVDAPMARLAFSVVPGAPIGEPATVELVVTDATGLERARHAFAVVVEPPAVSLAAPVPNPSAGSATVTFTARGDALRLSVVDVLGREVAVLADGAPAPGAHTVPLPRLASGAYTMRLVGRTEAHAERFTVVR